ncbi:MAG: M14 family zinc carboxypeptidase [bacterium]
MRIIQRFFLLVGVLCFVAAAFGQLEYRTHMLVKVFPESTARLQHLYTLHQLDIAPGETREEPYVFAYPEDLELLRQEGYAYEILYENFEQFQASRIDSRYDTLGAYHSYLEMVAVLDSIHNDHPDITTAKFSIGQSIQGRELWCMKISDNPEVDENEPELFFNGLTHAREPMGMETVLYTMNFLTDYYGDSANATAAVNGCELYFIPCMNPDGYVYNQQTNPGGGGMWRKNRRLNYDGTYGVDLNRNYGWTWGLDNNGSSPYPDDETYRGTAAFSEPETDYVRQFFNSRHFIISADYHTWGDYVLKPWGTSYFDGDGLTAHDAIYNMLIDSMAYWIHSVNLVWYDAGTVWQTLGYNVNGGSFDWEYGDTLQKGRVFAVSTEIGNSSDYFWAPQSRIDPLRRENHAANMFLARIAASLPFVEHGRVMGMVRDAVTHDPLEAQVEVVGGTQSTTCSPSGQYMLFLRSDSTYTLRYSHYGYVSQEHAVHVTTNDTTYQDVDLVPRPIITVFIEDFESGAPGWTHSSPSGWGDQWHVSTERAHGGTHSYKCGDAGTGVYANLLDARLMSPAITGLPSDARLYFWMQIQGELSGAYPDSAYDGGLFEISANGGAFTQVTPVGGYPKTFRWFRGGGNPATGPMRGMPCWAQDLSWVEVAVELTSFAGQSIQLRYRFGSDAGTGYEGWYVDDVRIVALGEPVVDVTGLTIIAEGNDLHLRWNPDANYGYRIYDDDDPMSSFTNQVGETTANEFVVVGGAASTEIKFYVVRGWDGSSFQLSRQKSRQVP